MNKYVQIFSDYGSRNSLEIWIFVLSIKEYTNPNPDLFPKNSHFVFPYELFMIHADKQTILLKKENGHLSDGEKLALFTDGEKITFNHDGRSA